MFGTKKVVKDAPHLAAFEKAGHFKYGDVITKEWLMEHFGIIEPTVGTKDDFQRFAFEFLSAVELFKKEMLVERKMLLKTERNKGYRILRPDEHLEEAMNDFKQKVYKEFRRVNLRLNNIELSLLSTEQQQQLDMNLGKVAAMAAFNRRKMI